MSFHYTNQMWSLEYNNSQMRISIRSIKFCKEKCRNNLKGEEAVAATEELEGNVHRQPEATTFLMNSVAIGIFATVIQSVIHKILIKQIVDCAIKRHVLAQLIASTQMKQAVRFVVTDLVACGFIAAITLTAIFTAQPGTEVRTYRPIQLGVEHMFRSIGQRLALVRAAFLLAVGVGIVGTQGPAIRQWDSRGKFDTASHRFVHVHALAIFIYIGPITIIHAARSVKRTCKATVQQCWAIGNFVFEFIVKQGYTSTEAGQAVIVSANFCRHAGFRLQTGSANVGNSTLSTEPHDAISQLIKAWGFVAATDATLEGPVIICTPDQITARADVAAELIMVIIACAYRQSQVICKTPFVFAKY